MSAAEVLHVQIAGRAGTHSVQELRAGGTRCERDDKGRAEQAQCQVERITI